MSDRSSPNHVYRTVWNDALGAMVAVAEVSSGKGQGSGGCRVRAAAARRPPGAGSLATLAVSIAIGWGTMATARANPTGAQVVHGQASVVGKGNVLTVTTQNGPGTSHSVINWQSFSIPGGSSTTFVQPGSNSLSINRVITNTPSAIFGTLNSNGRLVLVNQSGIAIGAGAVVDTAGFTASALHMSDADALAGRLRFGAANAGMGGASGITVGGRITARDGDVVLIAPDIQIGASALVQAPNGSAILAAGQQVEITGRGIDGISMMVQAPSDAALNLGQLQGDAVAIFAGTLRHSGEIQANSVQVQGGKVVLRAVGAATVDGRIQARGTGGQGGKVAITGHDVDIGTSARIDANASGNADGGQVIVMADMDSGTARFAGQISARGGEQGGNGGFVETSGAKLKIADTARVRASGPKGLAGTWLLDPTDFTVGSGPSDNISGATLSMMLNGDGGEVSGDDVTIRSTDSETAGQGNITINDPVSWSANLLTLEAQKDIHINANLDGSGTASLLLKYGQETPDGDGAKYYIAAGKSVSLPEGFNFSTKLGNDSAIHNYQVITALGDANSVTMTDLQGIRAGAGNDYALGANIDATATAAWNDGEGFEPINNFEGRLEGLGHTISNLTINRPDNDKSGLFSELSVAIEGSNAGMVSNLSLANANVRGKNYVGILAGRNIGGSIIDSRVGGIVNGSDYVGGMVGQSASGSTIVASHSTATVNGSSNTGGLVGLNRGDISDSSASGNVTGTSSVGGLLGYNYGANTTNNHASGIVSGTQNVGGLVGHNRAGGISQSHATGTVSGTSQVGGLVGYLSEGGECGECASDVSESYASGNVTASGNFAGGLVGGVENPQAIRNSHYNIDAVTINGAHRVTRGGLFNAQYQDWIVDKSLNIADYNGTLVPNDGHYDINSVQGIKELLGFADDSDNNFRLSGNIDLGGSPGLHVPYLAASTFDGAGFTISNLVVNEPKQDYIGLFGITGSGTTIQNLAITNAAVTGHSKVGVLAGFNRAVVSGVTARGTVSGTDRVGGLIGENHAANVSESGAIVAVNGANDVGGLVGHNYYGSVSASLATGNVNGSGSRVGGLVGHNYSGAIGNSYATGSVSGNGQVGGLVGLNDGYGGSYGTIDRSYARGAVGAGASNGGLVGFNGSYGTISDSRWDTGTSATGIGSNLGSVAESVGGLNNAQFTAIESFGGWDIDAFGGSEALWRIYEGNTAPLLRGFLKPLMIADGNSSRVYNGSTDGPFNSADPLILGTASTPSKDVGTYLFDASGLYSTQFGYDLSAGNGNLTITPFPVNLSGSRVYDGTNVAAAANLQIGPLVGAETLTLNGAGNVADKNAASAKPLSALGTLALGNGANGGLVSNYSFSGGAQTLTITPASVTLTVSNVSKAYDGSTEAAASALVSAGSLFGSDTVGGGNFAFSNKNAGIGNKTVTGSAVTVNDGNGGANYLVTVVPNNTSTITPAALTLTTSNVTKTYDGTTAAAGVPIVSAGSLFGSDSLGGGTFAFTNKNVGAGNKTVSVSGVTINDGNGGQNYNLTLASNTTSTINPANLTVTTSDVVKPYDGTTTAAGTAVVGAGSLFDTDGLSGGTFAFTDKNAGAGNKTVSVSDVTVNDGNGGQNYKLTLSNNTTSTINPAQLTLSTDAVNKVYDGSTAAAGTAVITGGALLEGDSLSGGVFAFLDRNVGTGKTVTVSGVTVNDGNNGANYDLSFTSNTSSSISVLGLSTWTGEVDNQWSNPGNWSAGAVPALSNVLAVAIPAGSGNVVFDAVAGPTTLRTLDSLRPMNVAGGNLEITTGLTANDYNQSAGAVSGSGSMTVNGKFAQTGGTVELARVQITQTSGNLAIAKITTPDLLLAAPTGAISQSGPLVAGTLSTLSQSGTVLTGPGNRIDTLSASNTGTGNITLVNGVPLTLANVTNAGGGIDITSTGGITTVGLVSAPATPLGNVALTANSPLTIGAAGVRAGGSIVLTATDLTSAGNMTLNGPLSAGNTVTMAAANNLVQNSAVRGANGVTATAGGTMTFGPQATTDNPPVQYTAGGAAISAPRPAQDVTPESSAAGNIIVTFLDLFQRELNKQATQVVETNPDGSIRRRFGSSLVTEEEICR